MRPFALLVALGLSGLLPASAHEVGAMRAKASFQASGTFTIDVVVDAEHLPRGVSAHRIAEHVEVAFDAGPAHLEVQPSPDASAGRIAFRLAGRTPPGTKTFGWSVSLPVGRYLLGIEEEGEEGVLWRWVEGGGSVLTVPLLHAPPPPTRSQVIRQYL